MTFFTQFSTLPKRTLSPSGASSPSAPSPKCASAPNLLGNIVYCVLALTLFYFVSRPAFK